MRALSFTACGGWTKTKTLEILLSNCSNVKYVEKKKDSYESSFFLKFMSLILKHYSKLLSDPIIKPLWESFAYHWMLLMFLCTYEPFYSFGFQFFVRGMHSGQIQLRSQTWLSFCLIRCEKPSWRLGLLPLGVSFQSRFTTLLHDLEHDRMDSRGYRVELNQRDLTRVHLRKWRGSNDCGLTRKGAIMACIDKQKAATTNPPTLPTTTTTTTTTSWLIWGMGCLH